MKKKLPTKEEIKAARALRKQGRALISQANKVLEPLLYRRRQGPIRRHISPKEIAFRTWLHDYSILMPAVARTHEAAYWSPVDLAAHAAMAADRMQHEVAMRRPTPNVSDRELRISSRKIWFNWQAQFDEFVHAMSAATTLDANAVVDRAAALADAMMKVVEKRKLRGKK